ncbi:hypothetical protein [Shinella oryzae]|uniref:Uncharacterized protein n=1 Tax=Shinella oryzae TaxID=2871820 RepID=A0ABY9K8J3_9HYPH|nr:hypothetical protein [Shinella oryzae]WLS03122.1 hypothetical protein Q9315_00300 [Shinella oryzae]
MARRNDYVSDDEVQKCMLIAAILVDRYGDEMLPLLERLEHEYKARKEKRDSPKHVDRIKALLAVDKAPTRS